MSDIRPAASLTSNLLARRGDARPAMRRQPISHLHLPVAQHDDLGWNDIGDDVPPAEPAMAHLALAPDLPMAQDEVEQQVEQLQTDALETDAPESVTPPMPSLSPLTSQLEAIAQRINQAPKDSSFRPLLARSGTEHRKARSAPGANGRKAAFTLRIDGERHLRLRLLSALTHRSSQQLLIEALDELLSRHGTVEELAARVGSKSALDDVPPLAQRQA